MSESFKELGGSPVEQYDLEGFNARREFLIDWDDRDAFAAEALGIATECGGSTWANYPGKTSVFAFSVSYEPFDPDSPDCQELTELTGSLNSYTGSFAKAVVKYKTVSPRDRDDGPDNETGTHLTYRMNFASDYQTIPPRGWTWNDNPALPLSEGIEFVKTIPVTEHHLTWHQVVNPPWDAISDLQGKVNSGVFLDCDEATLLFVGAEANKLFRSGFDAGASEFCWQIHYVFRQRAVKYDGQAYGWNHFYRDDPAGWIELVNGTARMYDLADFTPLFESAAPA